MTFVPTPLFVPSIREGAVPPSRGDSNNKSFNHHEYLFLPLAFETTSVLSTQALVFQRDSESAFLTTGDLKSHFLSEII